jgi:hypothetical protein
MERERHHEREQAAAAGEIDSHPAVGPDGGAEEAGTSTLDASGDTAARVAPKEE